MKALIYLLAHQHFWKYDPQVHAWIDESMATLRRDHLPAELRAHLDREGIDGCVAVQVEQHPGENHFLRQLTDEHPWILGFVGWVDLCSAGVDEELAELRQLPAEEDLQATFDSLHVLPVVPGGMSSTPVMAMRVTPRLRSSDDDLPPRLLVLDEDPPETGPARPLAIKPHVYAVDAAAHMEVYHSNHSYSEDADAFDPRPGAALANDVLPASGAVADASVQLAASIAPRMARATALGGALLIAGALVVATAALAVGCPTSRLLVAASSMAALQSAVQALQSGDVDMVVTGGADRSMTVPA